MELLKHLNDVRPEDLEGHMMREFGVRVVREGDLAILKYTNAAVWASPVTHECRGVIIRDTGDLWVPVSRPFCKFFNYNQGHVAEFDHGDLALVEKADGTCIQLWWDESRGLWRASTLGTITTTAVNDLKETFEELFWRVSGLREYLDDFRKGVTYIFELCTTDNQIVTRYDQDHVVYLGNRCAQTGEPQADCVLRHAFDAANVRSPHFINDSFASEEEVLAFVERESRNHEKYGQNPEGFVGYVGGRPVVKYKNITYMQLHSVGGGDLACSRKRIREAFFEGILDDIREAIPARLESFVEALATRYREMELEALEALRALSDGGPYNTRKQWAQAVKDHLPKDLQQWGFKRGPEGDLSFEDWISSDGRYEKLHRLSVDELRALADTL